MYLINFLVSLFLIFGIGFSFRLTCNTKNNFNYNLRMSLGDNDGPENERNTEPIINNKQVVKTLSFPLAKEYHKFLLKYKILTNDDIQEINNNNFNSIPNYFDKFTEDSTSIKIAKSRLENYKIFENNWSKINKINYVKNRGDNYTSFKIGLNKYADSIDFNNNYKSDNIPSDLMKRQIKKNVKFNWKIINNKFKRNIDNIDGYLQKPSCVFEMIKGILNIKLKSIEKPLKENYIDWSSNGMTTKVKDQGQCGSCWAFSSVSTLESYMRIQNRSTELLSEQELVDCSTENHGCNGGFMDTAFDYVIKNNGLHSDKDYPYVGKDCECQSDCCKEYNNYFDENKNMELKILSDKNSNVEKESLDNFKIHRRVPGSEFNEYRFFEPESVEDIKKSLRHGPIAIALDANSFFFRFYESGVVDLPSEYSRGLNHAVMLVGYGKDDEGEHWIIQNSWGPEWGDKGFIKVRINEGEGTFLCQIYGVYPYK